MASKPTILFAIRPGITDEELVSRYNRCKADTYDHANIHIFIRYEWQGEMKCAYPTPSATLKYQRHVETRDDKSIEIVSWYAESLSVDGFDANDLEALAKLYRKMEIISNKLFAENKTFVEGEHKGQFGRRINLLIEAKATQVFYDKRGKLFADKWTAENHKEEE